MDNCHYCNTYYVLVHIQTHTATVLCICNPAHIYLHALWHSLSHGLSKYCQPILGQWFAMITMAHSRFIETSLLFFTTCRPRLFHWSKPSETSLAHLHWVMWCPSLCVVEAFVKGRWTTSPCTIITHTS